MDNHKWAEQETQRLIAIGVNPLDAQRSTAWTLRTMPAGADPATWIPSAFDLEQGVDGAATQDANAVWYERAPRKFKRLLNAVVKRG